MATYPITITNPDAETGTTTGWTGVGEGIYIDNTNPHSGTYCFAGWSGFNEGLSGMYQVINIDAAEYAKIDNYEMQVFVRGWHRSEEATDTGTVRVRTYSGLNATGTLLDDATSSSHTGAYAQKTVSTPVTPGARSIRIDFTMLNGDFAGPYLNTWDDIEAWFDDVGAVSIDAQMLGAYALATYPAAEARAHQLGVYTVEAAEESSTVYAVDAQMLGVYTLVQSYPDRRDLNAWTFTQDDHDFYVLNLGVIETLVYDKLSKQWCRWKSPEYPYWRPSDGVTWAGMTVACDRKSNKIYQVNAENRLEYGTTPIESKVTGMVPARGRQALPCYSAELVVSQGQPSNVADGSQNYINLRFTDDGYLSFVDMGSQEGEAFGSFTHFRWYGLGQITAPGRIFEIVNYGYARRIDSFDISVGGPEE